MNFSDKRSFIAHVEQTRCTGGEWFLCLKNVRCLTIKDIARYLDLDDPTGGLQVRWTLFRDHTWVSASDLPWDLADGDTVMFTATVEPYTNGKAGLTCITISGRGKKFAGLTSPTGSVAILPDDTYLSLSKSMFNTECRRRKTGSKLKALFADAKANNRLYSRDATQGDLIEVDEPIKVTPTSYTQNGIQVNS